MKNSEKIALSLAAAFTAGAVAGILLAPARGKRTRERISRKGQHLVNSIEEAIQEGKSSFTDIRDNVKDTFQTLKKDAEHLVKC